MRKSSEIHADIVRCWAVRKGADLNVLKLMREMESIHGYFEFGVRDIFEYGVKIHGMTESEANAYTRVSRAAFKVPELMEAVLQGDLTLSHGVVLSGVMNSSIPLEEKKAWLKTAKDCSKEDLRNKIAESKPDIAAKESERKRKESKSLTSYSCRFTDEEVEMVKHLQGILRAKNWRETFLKAVKYTAEMKDQVKKAERAKDRAEKKAEKKAEKLKVKNEPVISNDPVQTAQAEKPELKSDLTSNANDSKKFAIIKPDKSISKTVSGFKRVKTPAAVLHEVNLRDKRSCDFIIDEETQTRCDSTFCLDYHHHIPLSQGGTDTADNIRTLCKGHHKYEHHYF
jgi:hypothetical protein